METTPTQRLQILHVSLLHADSRNPIVRRDGQQLLVYLLYSLSLKHLEAAQASKALCVGALVCWCRAGWGRCLP